MKYGDDDYRAAARPWREPHPIPAHYLGAATYPGDRFPNNDPKPVGTYVVNVHPCGHSDEEGVVIQAEPDYPGEASLTVATGTGSTCYGPAKNWAPTDRRPEWLDRAKPDFLARLARVRGEEAAA